VLTQAFSVVNVTGPYGAPGVALGSDVVAMAKEYVIVTDGVLVVSNPVTSAGG
jgi:hypothetical protein